MGESTPNSIVTLRDVARRVHVHHSTASRALHDDPRISVAVRQKVQRAAREMGYRPNPMATALNIWRASKAKLKVGYGLAWLNHWAPPAALRAFRTFEGYWQGAYTAAEKQGYRLEEFIVNDAASLKSVAKVLRARNVPGILIAPGAPVIPAQAWEEFPWQDFSVVRFGRRMVSPRFGMVTAGQTYDCIMAFQKMGELGYERIGLVTHQLSVGYLGGYLAAQGNVPASRRLTPMLLPRTMTARSRQGNEFDRWLKQTKPDAILTDHIPVREALAKAGYSVPKEMGLAALNVSDVHASAGIYQYPEQTGQAAIETLISLIQHNHRGIPEVPREILICGRWQDGSTLPPRR